MAEHVCKECGAAAGPAAPSCPACGASLGSRAGVGSRRRRLTVAGALLVLLGAYLPWVFMFGLTDGIELTLRAVELRYLEDTSGRLLVAEAGVRLALVALALVMLRGRSAALTRRAALLAAVLPVGYAVAAVSLGASFVLSVGLGAVWLGSVLGRLGARAGRQEPVTVLHGRD